VRRAFAVFLSLLFYYIVIIVREDFRFVVLSLVETWQVSVAIYIYSVSVCQSLETWLSVYVSLCGLHFASA